MGVSNWIARWRRPNASSPTATSEVTAKSSVRPLSQHELADLEHVLPILVPGEFLALPGWPGPIESISTPEFALTWGVVTHPETTSYVDCEKAANWDRAGIDWRKRATENLRRIAEAHPFSHRWERPDGTIFMVAMLFPGNLSMARLLVPNLLDDVFPAGYRVAVPELTCVMACATDLSEEECATAQKLAQECYEGGSDPVSDKFFDPKVFW